MRWADVRPDDVERVKTLSERRLTAEEWDAYVNQPVTPDEERQLGELLVVVLAPVPDARRPPAVRAPRLSALEQTRLTAYRVGTPAVA